MERQICRLNLPEGSFMLKSSKRDQYFEHENRTESSSMDVSLLNSSAFETRMAPHKVKIKPLRMTQRTKNMMTTMALMGVGREMSTSVSLKG